MRTACGILVLSLLIRSLLFGTDAAIILDPGMCNRDQVDDLQKGQTAPVYAGPGRGHLQVDELKRGDIVYSCDETSDQWVHILFRFPQGACGENSGESLHLGEKVPLEKLSGCKSGWVDLKHTAFRDSLSKPPRYSGGECNLAQIDYLGRDSSVPVYAGPSTGFVQLGELKKGDMVYTCGGGREWYNVYFSPPGGPCSERLAGVPIERAGLPEETAVTCKSGWVESKFINILSG